MSEVKVVSAACIIRITNPVGAVSHGDSVIISIPPPARHHHILHSLHSLELNGDILLDDQGFLLSNGLFVNRATAAKIALESGQIKELKWPPDLYSEDLW